MQSRGARPVCPGSVDFSRQYRSIIARCALVKTLRGKAALFCLHLETEARRFVTPERQQSLEDFTLRKEILFESDDKFEVARQDMALIIRFRANDPKTGYNRNPRCKDDVIDLA